MMYEDSDTLNKGQQNKNQSQADKSKKQDAMTAKLLASAAAGLVVGVGTTYAAGRLVTNEEIQTEDSQSQEDATTVEQQPAAPTVEERIEALEEKERIRELQEQERQRHEAERQRQEQQRQKNEVNRQQKHNDDDDPKENDIFKGHDVKIGSVEEHTLEDGTTVHVYYGTVDGHHAQFLANSDGKVVAAVVDVNDNGDPDDNEMIDLSQSNVTTQYLAEHQVAPSTEHEVSVVAVENDVELGGETVNVAYVTMDDQPVVFIDRTQNGEVDVAITDHNHNGHLDEGEARDVSDAHIIMPTADDVSGNTLMAGTEDGSEDYSNDADVTFYDV